MAKCADPHCRFSSTKPGGMANHYLQKPHHQPGAKFKDFKGDNANKKAPKNGGKNQGGEATAK